MQRIAEAEQPEPPLAAVGLAWRETWARAVAEPERTVGMLRTASCAAARCTEPPVENAEAALPTRQAAQVPACVQEQRVRVVSVVEEQLPAQPVATKQVSAPRQELRAQVLLRQADPVSSAVRQQERFPLGVLRRQPACALER